MICLSFHFHNYPLRKLDKKVKLQLYSIAVKRYQSVIQQQQKISYIQSMYVYQSVHS